MATAIQKTLDLRAAVETLLAKAKSDPIGEQVVDDMVLMCVGRSTRPARVLSLYHKLNTMYALFVLEQDVSVDTFVLFIGKAQAAIKK